MNTLHMAKSLEIIEREEKECALAEFIFSLPALSPPRSAVSQAERLVMPEVSLTQVNPFPIML
jgi:hypothetical protein